MNAQLRERARRLLRDSLVQQTVALHATRTAWPLAPVRDDKHNQTSKRAQEETKNFKKKMCLKKTTTTTVDDLLDRILLPTVATARRATRSLDIAASTQPKRNDTLRQNSQNSTDKMRKEREFSCSFLFRSRTTVNSGATSSNMNVICALFSSSTMLHASCAGSV